MPATLSPSLAIPARHIGCHDASYAPLVFVVFEQESVTANTRLSAVASTFTEGMANLCGPDVTLIPQVDPERSITVLMGWHRQTNNPLVEYEPADR